MQLAAETARQATEIHADASLDVAQKRAALVALKKNTQPALDALMPPVVQQRLATNAQAWLTGLGTGAYKPIAATLPGASGLMMTVAQSVDHPPPANITQLQRLPSRPTAK